MKPAEHFEFALESVAPDGASGVIISRGAVAAEVRLSRAGFCVSWLDGFGPAPAAGGPRAEAEARAASALAEAHGANVSRAVFSD